MRYLLSGEVELTIADTDENDKTAIYVASDNRDYVIIIPEH